LHQQSNSKMLFRLIAFRKGLRGGYHVWLIIHDAGKNFVSNKFRQHAASIAITIKLPVVIALGDFYQFPPISSKPLWIKPFHTEAEQVKGWRLWREFNNVVILTESMRHRDKPFQELLKRGRDVTMTPQDITALNERVVDKVLARGDVTSFDRSHHSKVAVLYVGEHMQ